MEDFGNKIENLDEFKENNPEILKKYKKDGSVNKVEGSKVEQSSLAHDMNKNVVEFPLKDFWSRFRKSPEMKLIVQAKVGIDTEKGAYKEYYRLINEMPTEEIVGLLDNVNAEVVDGNPYFYSALLDNYRNRLETGLK